MSRNKTPVFEPNRARLRPITWCRWLVNAGYAMVGVITLAHVVWYFAAYHYLAVVPHQYVWEYIIFPFIGLLLLNAAADFLVRSQRVSLLAKEYVSLLLFLIFSLYLCLTHRIAAVLLGSFVLSVFASTVFSNMKITRRIFEISNFALLLVCVEIVREKDFTVSMLMEIFVAWDILLCAYLLSKVLIRYGQENIVALMSAYHLQQHMQEQLKLDPFTGVYNKKTFNELLPKWIDLCRARNERLSLAMIDVDHFKRINDDYGHAAGDRELLHLSQILKGSVSENIHAFRIGGEEFAILMKDCGIEKSFEICDKMRAAMESTSLYEEPAHVTFSCGLACLDIQDLSPAELSRAADSALYQAKNAGRNRVVVYHSPARGIF